MKRFTSLMLMLLCAVTTLFAQTLPATDKAFTVVAEGHNSGAKPGWAINNEKTAMVSFGNTVIADEAQYVKNNNNMASRINVHMKLYIPLDNPWKTNVEGKPNPKNGSEMVTI